MKLARRRVASTVRYSPSERPVTRMVRFPFGSIIEYWLFCTQPGKPGAGTSSTAYSASSPGSLRQMRGSEPTPSHFWLTGADSVALGAGTLVQRT